MTAGRSSGALLMSSLYKRAERDAWMQALLIVVEGQVRSALQDHPGWVAEAVTDRKGRRKAPDPHKIARSGRPAASPYRGGFRSGVPWCGCCNPRRGRKSRRPGGPGEECSWGPIPIRGTACAVPLETRRQSRYISTDDYGAGGQIPVLRSRGRRLRQQLPAPLILGSPTRIRTWIPSPVRAGVLPLDDRGKSKAVSGPPTSSRRGVAPPICPRPVAGPHFACLWMLVRPVGYCAPPAFLFS